MHKSDLCPQLLQTKSRVSRFHLVLLLILLLLPLVHQWANALSFVPPFFGVFLGFIVCCLIIFFAQSMLCYSKFKKMCFSFWADLMFLCGRIIIWTCLWFPPISFSWSISPLCTWHRSLFSGMLVEILDGHHIRFSMWPLHIHAASGNTPESQKGNIL